MLCGDWLLEIMWTFKWNIFEDKGNEEAMWVVFVNDWISYNNNKILTLNGWKPCGRLLPTQKAIAKAKGASHQPRSMSLKF